MHDGYPPFPMNLWISITPMMDFHNVGDLRLSKIHIMDIYPRTMVAFKSTIAIAAILNLVLLISPSILGSSRPVGHWLVLWARLVVARHRSRLMG
jgi:hypothetical protein